MKPMVVQVVRVSIKPDQRDRSLEPVRINAAQTRAEEGCESYRVCEDIERPNAFVLVEEWTSMDTQYAHFRNPEFGELMGSLSEVLAGPPDVSVHQVASTQTLDEALAAAGVPAR
jgi:quinol monooxygenase YgiN